MRITTNDPKLVAAIAKATGEDIPEGATLVITAPKSVAGRACACGCGTKTSGGVWAPGHDAKHKSMLFGLVRGTDEAAAEAASAELTKRGWPQPSAPKTMAAIADPESVVIS